MLTNFEIIHARALDDDPEICCMDGRQRVVAHIAREAWNDYLELPSGQTLRTAAEGNILAETNLTALQEIIAKRYAARQFEMMNRAGSTLPYVILKLDDLRQAPGKLSRSALDMARAARFR